MRVFEIAKEVGVSTKEVMNWLGEAGIVVKSHVNKLPPDQVELVRRKAEAAKAPATPPKLPEALAPSLSSPKHPEPARPPSAPFSGASSRPSRGGRQDVTFGSRTREKFKFTSKVKKRIEEQVKPPERKKAFRVRASATISELSRDIGISIPQIMKFLMKENFMIPQNKPLTEDLIRLIADDFHLEIELAGREENLIFPDDSVAARLAARSPVVTVMGHVDHGKTLLLDSIRKSNVAAKEVGGITQKIGAYQVDVQGHKITFIDTPGHRAFTAMRAQGAKITDIAILVVAADESVKPQTLEAFDHIRAAKVEMIVAINKIDKPGANPEKVKKDLSELGAIPEEWGGDTFFVLVSARTGEGIDRLLETILEVAHVLELKSDPEARTQGVVIEGSQSKEFGKSITVIVQKGTLRKGDVVVIGPTWGRVKAMVDDRGAAIEEALPGTPVRIAGIEEVPKPGDVLFHVDNEKEARAIAERNAREEVAEEKPARPIKLEDFLARAKEEGTRELRVILKSISQGSIEALKKEIANIRIGELEIKVIRAAVGDISSSDILLARASNAVVIGFDVSVESVAQKEAAAFKVDVRTYDLIFDVVDDLRRALLGLLEPERVEEEIGEAEIRAVFTVTATGVVAGVFVRKGLLERGMKIVVSRSGKESFTGNLTSLRRFADDVPRVLAGFECGIGVEGLMSLQEGDTLKCLKVVEKRKSLEEVFGSQPS